MNYTMDGKNKNLFYHFGRIKFGGMGWAVPSSRFSDSIEGEEVQRLPHPFHFTLSLHTIKCT